MKVLLPEGKKLNSFEHQLQKTLEQTNLEGYALVGFRFVQVNGQQLSEIDALVLLQPGIFVCLEAKGYGGKWTGSANTKWFSDGREIESIGVNPYDQVNKYSLAIKNKLNQIHKSHIKSRPVPKKERAKQYYSNDCGFYVNSFVVAPDDAKIEIDNAVVDEFQPVGTIVVCHCSKLEQVLSQTPAGRGSGERVAKLGGLEQVISELIGIPVTELDGPNPGPAPIRLSPITLGLICASGLLAITTAATQYFWSNRPCEVPTETRINNICYRDLARTPLRIGILSSPDQYANFKSYLKNQLGEKVSDVVIEGNANISYAEVQNKIAKQEWDIVFAFSPMNGMRAKDNGYIWLARMFPQLPLTYQAALFVKADSPIQSLNDIKTTTKIALGDFNSASSFYMPTYDLYGKSMTVTAGNRSSQIKDLVASGMADIGAGVYSFIKNDSRFRVIHVSREIPGSGVYISPKIDPQSQEQIRQILMNAPEEIKREANYGAGMEPDYEVFRGISLRADEVIGCANFDRQPVQFFCRNPNSQQIEPSQDTITGRITGFTNDGKGMVRLRFEEQSGKVCQLSIALKTLSGIPNGTSPGMINRKQVKLTGVKLDQLSDSSCELKVTEPGQLTVL